MPKPGTRKRQPASTHTKDAPTAQKAKGRPKKRFKSAVADPLERLNSDTFNILLSYLSERDIVRCERLSPGWNLAIKEWVLKFGCRFHFRHAWKPLQGDDNESRDSIFAAYKRQARCQYNIRSGKTLSGLKLESAFVLSTQGKYVAWANPSQPDGRVAWQSLEPSEGGVVAAAKTFAAQTYFRAPGRSSMVANLAMGPDGLLLVTYHVPNYRPYLIRKVLVISPTDKKVIWRREYGDEWPNRGLVPLLIGRHWIYCARWNNTSWDLVAHDFRADKEVYQAPVLTRSFAMNLPDSFASDHKRTQNAYRLLQTSHSNEVILELCDRKEGETRCVRIINGTSGQFTQKHDFPETSLRYLTPDPGGNYFASVSYFPNPVQRLDASSHSCFEKYVLIVVRRFSCHDDGHLSPLPADVIFAFKESRTRGSSYTEPMWAVDPFTMAVASSVPIPSNAPEFASSPWKVCGHPLVPTEDSDLYEAARERIRAQLTSEPLAINGCFIVGDGKIVSLPPRPEIGRHKRKPLRFSYGAPTEMRFLSDSRLLLAHNGSKCIISFA